MQKYYTYVLYLLTSIFVVTLYLNDFTPLSSVQRSLNDFLCTIAAEEGIQPNIAIISIDGKSFDKHGPWPWNRDLLADLTAAAASADPKAIVLDLNLMEDPEQDKQGYTEIMADQFSFIDNVVIPYDISPATYQSKKTSTPEHLFSNSISVANPVGVMSSGGSIQARKIFLPAAKILGSDPHLGFGYSEPDNDQILRRQSLVMNYEGYYYPSVGLLAAARYFNIKSDDIIVTEGESVKIGFDHAAPINREGDFYLNFSSGRSFPTYSAADVLTDGFDFTHLRNKLVLIGPDDLNASELFDSPNQLGITPLYVHATVAENIINNNYVTEKPLSAGTDLLILFALGALCAFLLPRVILTHRLIILFGLLLVLANMTYFMLSSFNVLTETLYFAFELLLFMAIAPMLDSELITGTAKAKKAAASEKKKATFEEYSKELQEAPLREIKQDANAPEEQATRAMALEDESGPLDHQAVSLDDTGMVNTSDKTSAIDSGANEVESGSEPFVISTGRGDAPDRVIDEEPTVSNTAAPAPPHNPTPAPKSNSQSFPMPTNPADIKNLGRYQIEGVLGKGAMGLVYKGIDPAINRAVALKTIRLDFVHDPAEMEELKERLFREAQAAGKLSHPNIVTIYDVGSEGHLQYIAMEYLEGETIEEMISRKTKFNYRIIAQIIMQICSALEYAHDQGIIHRDIKPANIMVMPNYKVKVMDYGIAKIDSHSMTKTGIAMGTPNYISPEQLKGLKPDRRADIFSLGVVMYEMLLSKRPFNGDSITSLIYSILNTEPEKPSTINPQIPIMFDRIIDKTLSKNPDDRFQRAADVATSLEDFVESFASR